MTATSVEAEQSTLVVRSYGPPGTHWTSISSIGEDGTERVVAVGDIAGIRQHPVRFTAPNGGHLFTVGAGNLDVATTASVTITDPAGVPLATTRRDNLRSLMFRTTINVDAQRHRIQLVEKSVAAAVARRAWAIVSGPSPLLWVRAPFSFLVTIDGGASGSVTRFEGNGYRTTFDARIDWRVAAMFGITVGAFIRR